MGFELNKALTRRFTSGALALVLLAASLVTWPAAAVAAYPSFSFYGYGSGHGLGLSQYGARGYAEHGKTGEWIAAHYYPGATIKGVSARQIKVNLDAKASYDKSSGSYNAGYTRTAWVVRPGAPGAKISIGGDLLPDASYTVAVAKNASGAVTGIRVTATGFSKMYTTPLSIKAGSAGDAPLQIVSESGPFDSTSATSNFGTQYVRYRGDLSIAVNTSAIKNNAGTTTKAVGYLKLLNVLPMDSYLYGVVPRESPSSWPAESLRAQAIVARSYAQVGSSELYCTTWSQVYNGHSKTSSDRSSVTMHEASSTNSAVNSTSGLMVTYNGSPIQTFFHSSSGGHTANIEDVWPGTGEPSTTHPYRAGVDDPYCDSPLDPWKTMRMDGLVLAKYLAAKMSGEPSGAGVSVYVKALSFDRAASGFVRSVDVTWSNGAKSYDVSASYFRQAFQTFSYDKRLYVNSSGTRYTPALSTKFFAGAAFTRIAYADRYSTSVRVSQKAFPSAGSASVAVVVNGDDKRFPDALTSAALAGAGNGPVLLTQTGSISSGVLDEIRRLGVSKVFIVGGTQCVSDAVVARIAALGVATERLAGPDRYSTAAAVAMEMKSMPGVTATKVLVASGANWPDAATAAYIAAGSKRPIVLVAPDKVPAASAESLRDLGATECAVFGGPGAISDATVAEVCRTIGVSSPAKRFGLVGNRYTTSVEAAKWAVGSLGFTVSTTYLTSGLAFPDSVTGGLLAGREKHPMLMTHPVTPSAATETYLGENSAAIGEVVVLGGPAAVSDACAGVLASYAY